MSSKIVALIGAINGVNKQFSMPSKFVADSVRVIWNGQAYEPDDDKWGWTELTDQSIELVTAPRVGDIIQAFYTDKSDAGQIGVEGVKGSPFHPSNLYP